MKTGSNTSTTEQIGLLEHMISLSVDLHNFNANVQRVFDLSIVQWLVLRKIIDNPGISAGNLALTSGVHPSTMTPTLTRLDSMGLIHAFERASDLRRKLLVASWTGYQCNLDMEKSFLGSIQNISLDSTINHDFEKISTYITEISRNWAPRPQSSVK